MNERTEDQTAETGAALGVRPERVVMPDGHLPDFEGKPVLASCVNCTYNMDQSDGPEYGPSWYGCERPGKEYMGNLLYFPFKTAQKCCELHIAFAIDWDAVAREELRA